MSATKYLEELIYKFLTHRLTDDQKKNLSSRYDTERHIDEEAEDEMRYEMFRFLMDSVAWYSVINRLRDEVEDDDDEETDSDDTSSDDED